MFCLDSVWLGKKGQEGEDWGAILFKKTCIKINQIYYTYTPPTILVIQPILIIWTI